MGPLNKTAVTPPAPAKSSSFAGSFIYLFLTPTVADSGTLLSPLTPLDVSARDLPYHGFGCAVAMATLEHQGLGAHIVASCCRPSPRSTCPA